MNNNNRNGKEVHRGQMPDNLQKEGKPNPVNRIKKKNTSAAKNNIPAEPKKIPLNVNKNPGNPGKSNHKGQVIKLGEKEARIHPVGTTPRENTRTQTRTASAPGNREAVIEQPADYRTTTDKNQPGKADKSGFKLTAGTGKWLLIAAALFFIAWAVIFFYYNIGGNSHMLLALAVICAVISLVGRKKM